MQLLKLNRRMVLALGGFWAYLAGAARSGPVEAALYRARTIVTGQREETRLPGLMRCLPEVLVRVSGDPRLAEDPRIQGLVRGPQDGVTHIAYRDLYAFRPIKDEQGTRDRPYEMTVDYDPPMVDALLARLGSKPWLAQRPQLVVFLAVKHIATSYLLDSTIDAGDLQRQSFADAAWLYALEVIIPSAETLHKANLTVSTLPSAPLAALQDLTGNSDSQKALKGSLSWDKKKSGWIAAWQLEHEGQHYQWGIEGVNFDAAFRNAVGGAAQILSGNWAGPKQ